ncbi:CHRD domain-containing protein [Sphaerisporangium aureirubrum]|uniref:CHRD domain-containing protein n=1 Tax=Sphaerisporangium aureirubrum TaxID=1544736 RepID=A0ABW1NAV1_9ACTN
MYGDHADVIIERLIKMKRTLITSSIVLATGLVAAALTPAAAQAAPAATGSADAYFIGRLSGANEVPVAGGPAVGDRDGSAYVVIRISGNRVSFAGRWAKIGAPTAFHIHKGKAGTNGDVKIGFFGEALPGSARAVAGGVTVNDRALLAGIRKNPKNWYLNLHTAQFPGGAVRAQLQRIARPVDLTDVLAHDTHARLKSDANGAQEVRAPGKKVGDRDGAARWLVGVKDTKLRYAAIWSDLDPITNGHIHRGKKGVNGPVVADLFADANGLPGSIWGIAGVAPVKRDIARGIVKNPKNWYTNLHTTKFADGAVRGQLRSAHGSW